MFASIRTRSTLSRSAALAWDPAERHARREQGRPESQPSKALQLPRTGPLGRVVSFRKALIERCGSPQCSVLNQARARTVRAAGRRSTSTAKAGLVVRRAPYGFRVRWSAAWLGRTGPHTIPPTPEAATK